MTSPVPRAASRSTVVRAALGSFRESIRAMQGYFEDYVPGVAHELGALRVEEADIVEFARRYDPQPFHVDAQAAQRSPFGGLIASGWQTGALGMRLLAERYLSPETSLGSPGIDELRWLRPVRPGDTLSVRATVLEARCSRSKPDRGLVRTLVETRNQHGELVMSQKSMMLVQCREG